MVRSDRILLLGNKAFEEWIKFVQISKAEQIESECKCNLCWSKLQKTQTDFHLDLDLVWGTEYVGHKYLSQFIGEQTVF